MKMQRGGRSERGASMVEAALAAGIVFMLLFTIFESALVGRSFIAARDGSAAGARAGAVASNDALADYDTLRAVQRAASTTSGSAIKQIIVFKASGPGDSVPSACLSGPVAGLCNVYTGADFSKTTADFGPGGWASDDSWAPSIRQTSRSVGTDYVGVYVKVATGVTIVPLPRSLTDTSITRIEDTGN